MDCKDVDRLTLAFLATPEFLEHIQRILWYSADAELHNLRGPGDWIENIRFGHRCSDCLFGKEHCTLLTHVNETRSSQKAFWGPGKFEFSHKSGGNQQWTFSLTHSDLPNPLPRIGWHPKWMGVESNQGIRTRCIIEYESQGPLLGTYEPVATIWFDIVDKKHHEAGRCLIHRLPAPDGVVPYWEQIS